MYLLLLYNDTYEHLCFYCQYLMPKNERYTLWGKRTYFYETYRQLHYNISEWHEKMKDYFKKFILFQADRF